MSGEVKSYRLLHADVWTMIDAKGLSVAARHVFLLAEAGPGAHWSGVYYFPVGVVAESTGLDEESALRAIKELEGARLLLFDRARSLVYVPGMMLRQLGGVKNINQSQRKGLVNYLTRLPKTSSAVAQFIRDTFPPTDPDKEEVSPPHSNTPPGDPSPPLLPPSPPGDKRLEIREEGLEIREEGVGTGKRDAAGLPPPLEEAGAAEMVGGGNGKASGKGTSATIPKKEKEPTPEERKKAIEKFLRSIQDAGGQPS